MLLCEAGEIWQYKEGCVTVDDVVQSNEDPLQLWGSILLYTTLCEMGCKNVALNWKEREVTVDFHDLNLIEHNKFKHPDFDVVFNVTTTLVQGIYFRYQF